MAKRQTQCFEDYEKPRAKYMRPLTPPVSVEPPEQGGKQVWGGKVANWQWINFKKNVISPQAAEAQIGDAPFPEVPAPDMHTHSPACSSRHACPGTFWQVGWAWQLGFCKAPLLPWAASSKYPEWEEQALNRNFQKCKRRKASLRSLERAGLAAYSNTRRLSEREKHLC